MLALSQLEVLAYTRLSTTQALYLTNIIRINLRIVLHHMNLYSAFHSMCGGVNGILSRPASVGATDQNMHGHQYILAYAASA
jgi:hypothetical protein